MKRVVVESPFAGDTQLNLAYLRACLRDCLARDESPYASHAICTQPGVLRDEIPQERQLGMKAGREWYKVCHSVVAYVDLGVSPGMRAGIEYAMSEGIPVEYRRIDGWNEKYEGTKERKERAG